MGRHQLRYFDGTQWTDHVSSNGNQSVDPLRPGTVPLATQKADKHQKQLDRADAVAVPAAKSLGISGAEAQLPALLEALKGGGSVELKVASADSIGQILGRAAVCSDEVGSGLGEVLSSDAPIQIRIAVAAAIGKAKVDDARRALLMSALKKIGSPAN